jgi:hypothetical protein
MWGFNIWSTRNQNIIIGGDRSFFLTSLSSKGCVLEHSLNWVWGLKWVWQQGVSGFEVIHVDLAGKAGMEPSFGTA